MPSNSVIPVIVVPGIMGTNLRAKTKPSSEDEENKEVGPGKPAWRPPNTTPGGVWDALTWDQLKPQQRQRLLDPDTLAVETIPGHLTLKTPTSWKLIDKRSHERVAPSVSLAQAVRACNDTIYACRPKTNAGGKPNPSA
jgi:hypothetical protein